MRDVDFAGERFTSWMWWSYYAEGAICCSGSGVVKDDTLPISDDNVKPGLADALIVPYPQAIAGAPRSSRFDRGSRTLRLSYATRPVGKRLAAGARTVVFVPRRQYPTGYTVAASGARVVSGPTSPWVELVNRPGRHAVTVTIAPASGSSVQLPSEVPAAAG